MIRSLYTSSLGMTAQMKKMDVVSNNIANVNTTAYKKDIVATSAFEEALAKRTHDISESNMAAFHKGVGNITYGAYPDEIFTDFSQGSFTTTLNTFDLALSENGFFVVNKTDANGNTTEKYTRDGAFTVDKDGYLVTKDGGRVQGQNGDIIIPTGMVSIEKDGLITVNQEQVATLKVIDFEDSTTLRKQGDNYYTTTASSVQKAYEGDVRQGELEMSNVNTVKEMVDLITVSRAYEANQKIIQTLDTTLQRSVQDIGRKQ